MIGAFKTVLRRRLAATPALGDEQQIQLAKRIINEAESLPPNAFLALSGDKRFMFSASGNSVIMFGTKGRAWIAVGPAIGIGSEIESLEMDFIQRAKACRAYPAFYGLTGHDAERLSEKGFIKEKLGEKAVIDLEEYNFSGRGKRDIRSARNKAQSNGCEFSVMKFTELADHWAVLEKISSNWLTHFQAQEKSFSLGGFSAGYLKHFEMAVVFKKRNPIAFASLWICQDRVTVDLMRFEHEEGSYIMDYLFMELILWAQSNGFKSVDLGAAPLSGLRNQLNPSTVAKLGNFVSVHADRFYKFHGLRAYKNKFDPEWSAVYICAESHWKAAATAVAVAALTGAGIRTKLKRNKRSKANSRPLK